MNVSRKRQGQEAWSEEGEQSASGRAEAKCALGLALVDKTGRTAPKGRNARRVLLGSYGLHDGLTDSRGGNQMRDEKEEGWLKGGRESETGQNENVKIKG